MITRTIALYIDDSCGTYAAAIAYYAIFSLVPLSLITLSIFGLVVDHNSITNFVFEQLPLKETPQVQENVASIVSRAQSISAAGLGFGVLALLWSSSGIFSAVRKGLNAAAHRKTSRPFWHAKLLDIALVPALGILIILSVGLAAATDVLIERVGSLGPLDFDTNLALRISGYVLPGVVTFSMFALLYRYVPTARPIWSEALSGALFATALFELAKNLYAFAFSLTAFSTDTAIYAGFGTVLGFLLWLFMNASILLLGAEFGRALIRPEWREHADAETEAAALAADVSRAEPLPQTPARRHGRVS